MGFGDPQPGAQLTDRWQPHRLDAGLVTFLFKVVAHCRSHVGAGYLMIAPTPVSGFMMTGVKAAGFAGMVRLFAITLGDPANSLQAYTGWVHAAYGVSPSRR